MKHIQILLAVVFMQTTALAQFKKSFDDVNEYELSNNLWGHYEGLDYEKGTLTIDSILLITNKPDRFVLTMGLTSSLNTNSKTIVERLLEIAQNNNYSLVSWSKDVSDIYPELVIKFSNIFNETKRTNIQVDPAQKIAQMFVDDQVCIGSFYDNIASHAQELGLDVRVNKSNDCNEVFPKNTRELNSILSQHSNLSKAIVGEWVMSAIFFIIQHSQENEFIAFKPYMDNWYKNGDILPRNYALYSDRYNLYLDTPQLYGSQFKQNIRPLEFHTIKDIDNINKRRMKMGMENIERYAIYFGIKWNDEYVEKIKTDYNKRR